MIISARQLKPYFQSHMIEIVAAYSLQAIMHKPNLAGRMALWATELSGYDIRYVPHIAIKSLVLAYFIAKFTMGG